MENLQYVIEDRTIAELLGIQNFTNDESAVLELVKNAYDAGASMVNLDFFDTQLVIKDNGCGMNEETGKHIFEKFYQGDTSRSKQGNGLGLALVKKVIDVLGGEINVESEVGKGSTFEITLREQRL